MKVIIINCEKKNYTWLVQLNTYFNYYCLVLYFFRLSAIKATDSQNVKDFFLRATKFLYDSVSSKKLLLISVTICCFSDS